MRVVDDIHKVMDNLRKSVDASGNIDLPFILQEVIGLFDRVKGVLPTTNLEERTKIFKAIGEMHEFLQSETKRLASKSGLTEVQMVRFSENPDNFTKEQWDLISSVQSKMGDQAKEIKDVMKSLSGPALEVAPPSKMKEKSSKVKTQKKPKAKKGQLRG